MKNGSFKSVIVLLLITLFSGKIPAQDFTKVDAVVKRYPNKFSSLDKFAEKVNTDFTRDDEKARAIFTWIALNVEYDIGKYGVNERPVGFSYRTEAEKLAKLKEMDEKLATTTLKNKKAVCHGYSALFKIIANKVGLEAEIIPGTSKSHPSHVGAGPGARDHAWNAVKIGGEWKLLDVTWAAGTATGNPLRFEFRFNDAFFFTHPDTFFLNHFSDDKKWLLTDKTEKDFANLPLYYGNYLSGGYELISPKYGTFKGVRNGVLSFKIKNISPQDTVAYVFSKERIFKMVKPVFNGDVAEFEVEFNNNSIGLLTLYINRKSVLAYRINRG